MNIDQLWREDQLSKQLWDAITSGNTRRMREMLHPANQAPTGLQTYLEPALSDGEKILRKCSELQQLGCPRPAAQEGSNNADPGTAGVGDSGSEE